MPLDTLGDVETAFKRQLGINPLDVGAKGDGLTNDAPVLQVLLDQGISVRLPKDYTFLCASGISMGQDGSRVTGMGKTSVIKKAFNGTLFTSRKKDCLFRDFALDGNRAAGFTGSCISIAAAAGIMGACDRNRLINLYIIGPNTNGITLSGTGYTLVDECQVYDFAGPGIFLNGSTTNPDNCRYNEIRGCHVETTQDTLALQIRSDQANSDTSYTRVIGGYFSSPRFTIEASQSGSGVRQTGITVDGVTMVSRGSGTFNGGISFSNVDRCGLGGAWSYDVNGTSPITAAVELAASTAISVNGGQINGGITLGSCGLILDHSSRCSVMGVTVDGFLTTGVAGIRVYSGIAASADDNAIIGNVINFPVTGASLSGIHIQSNNAGATVSRNVISGNVVRGNGQATTLGTKFLNSSGTLDRTLIIGNCHTNVTTPITTAGSAGDTNTIIPAGTNQS